MIKEKSKFRTAWFDGVKYVFEQTGPHTWAQVTDHDHVPMQVARWLREEAGALESDRG